MDLRPTEKHALVSAGLADENGLNRRGIATALTSDRLLEIRRAQAPENLKGAAVQPGYEKAAALQTEEKVPEQAKAQEVAKEQDQKRILVRNEDQQSQEKKAEVKERKEGKKERKIERPEHRPRPQIDKGQELSR